MSVNDGKMFNYQFCRYIKPGVRDKSARMVVGKEFGIFNSFTLETSYYGYKLDDGSIRTFNEEDLF